MHDIALPGTANFYRTHTSGGEAGQRVVGSAAV